jgi:hypothetical protein
METRSSHNPVCFADLHSGSGPAGPDLTLRFR